MMSRRLAVAAAALMVGVGGLAFGAASASGQSQTSGPVQVWATPSLTGQGGGTILFTGAIGDYGKTKKLSSADSEAILKKGTIKVDLSKLRAAANNARAGVNVANCSVMVTVTAPVAVLGGTGAYAGITGSFTLTESLAGVLPKAKSGACNAKVSVPLGAFTSVTGSGTVG